MIELKPCRGYRFLRLGAYAWTTLEAFESLKWFVISCGAVAFLLALSPYIAFKTEGPLFKRIVRALVVLSIYGLVLFYGWLIPLSISIGLTLFAIVAAIPLTLWLVGWLMYVSWHMGRTVLQVSSSELAPGKTLDIAFRQTFNQSLLIQSITIELLTQEVIPDFREVIAPETIIQSASKTDQPVRAGEPYEMQATFRVPTKALPTSTQQDHQVTWLIRTTIKCKHTATFIEEYPLEVNARSAAYD